MNEQSSAVLNLRLQTWTSASFPTGSFTYSHGLETAIQDGRIHNPSSCQSWIETVLYCGSAWNDAVFMALAHRIILEGDLESLTLEQLNDLALALQAGRERHEETTALGDAYFRAATNWNETHHDCWQTLPQNKTLPIVVGVLGALHGMPKTDLIASQLLSTTSNLVWVATRLIPLGQNDSLRIIAALEQPCFHVAKKAAAASLDDLGSCSVLADMASMQHENLPSRVCKT